MMLVGVPESTIWCVHFTGRTQSWHLSRIVHEKETRKREMIHYTAIMLPCKCVSARVYMNYLLGISKSMEIRSKGAHTGELYSTVETVLSLCGEFYDDICMYSGRKDSFPGQCMRKDS